MMKRVVFTVNPPKLFGVDLHARCNAWHGEETRGEGNCYEAGRQGGEKIEGEVNMQKGKS